MLTTTAGKAPDDREVSVRRNGALASRKIWLPKLLYNALPWFYLVAGFGAFAATLYINQWFWLLPHYLLFSAACIHLGLFVYRRRRHRGDA
jgi:hypothetical protein